MRSVSTPLRNSKELTEHQVTTGCLVYCHQSKVQHRQRCIMQMCTSFSHIKEHVSLKKDSRGRKTSVDFLWTFRFLWDTAWNRFYIHVGTIRQFWWTVLVRFVSLPQLNFIVHKISKSYWMTCSQIKRYCWTHRTTCNGYLRFCSQTSVHLTLPWCLFICFAVVRFIS